MNSHEHQALFEGLVHQHSDSVFRFSFRTLGNWHDAEDHVNEVFEQAWKNIGSLRSQTSAKSWLFAICRNRLATKIKQRQNQKTDELADDPVGSTRNENDPFETDDLIQFAASQVDPKMMEVVLLVEMEQFTVSETAELLEVPRGTVLSRLHRGKSKLKELLEKEDVKNRDAV